MSPTNFLEAINLVTQHLPIMIDEYIKQEGENDAVNILIESLTKCGSKVGSHNNRDMQEIVYRHNRFLSTNNVYYKLKKVRYNKENNAIMNYEVFINLYGASFDVEVRKCQFNKNKWIVASIN